jgi:hypothetical protein
LALIAVLLRTTPERKTSVASTLPESVPWARSFVALTAPAIDPERVMVTSGASTSPSIVPLITTAHELLIVPLNSVPSSTTVCLGVLLASIGMVFLTRSGLSWS